MVDDYSISGVNDSCTIHTKLDLHMLDTFVAVAKLYFESMKQQSGDCTLAAKTCDLKALPPDPGEKLPTGSMPTSAFTTTKLAVLKFTGR